MVLISDVAKLISCIQGTPAENTAVDAVLDELKVVPCNCSICSIAASFLQTAIVPYKPQLLVGNSSVKDILHCLLNCVLWVDVVSWINSLANYYEWHSYEIRFWWKDDGISYCNSMSEEIFRTCRSLFSATARASTISQHSQRMIMVAVIFWAVGGMMGKFGETHIYTTTRKHLHPNTVLLKYVF